MFAEGLILGLVVGPDVEPVEDCWRLKHSFETELTYGLAMFHDEWYIVSSNFKRCTAPVW